MKNKHIIAWMDDLQLSAHLAKFASTHSYNLEFRDTVEEISEISGVVVLIIDLNSISEIELKKLVALRQNQSFTFLGFCEELNGALINYLTTSNVNNFQPMNINFGLFPIGEMKIRNKKERNQKIALKSFFLKQL